VCVNIKCIAIAKTECFITDIYISKSMFSELQNAKNKSPSAVTLLLCCPVSKKSVLVKKAACKCEGGMTHRVLERKLA
jgi:hypothetical protein